MIRDTARVRFIVRALLDHARWNDRMFGLDCRAALEGERAVWPARQRLAAYRGRLPSPCDVDYARRKRAMAERYFFLRLAEIANAHR